MFKSLTKLFSCNSACKSRSGKNKTGGIGSAADIAMPLVKMAGNGGISKKLLVLGLAGLAVGYLARPREMAAATGYVGKNH